VCSTDSLFPFSLSLSFPLPPTSTTLLHIYTNYMINKELYEFWGVVNTPTTPIPHNTHKGNDDGYQGYGSTLPAL